MTFRALRKEIRKLWRGSASETVVALLRYPRTLKKREAYRKMLEQTDRQSRFGAIYEGGLWHSSESGSGQGSELGYTENLRRWLPGVIRAHDIKSVVDAPCGDFNWMRLVLQDVNVDYSGFDIVASVIERNAAHNSGERVTFEVADICKDPLPDCDLLIIRDCLFHLSLDDIDLVLRNIAAVNYKFLLTTTHKTPEGFVNSDIVSGDFRIMDLFEPPFCFARGAVLDRVDDFPKGYPIEREMVLIPKADVPTALSGDR